MGPGGKEHTNENSSRIKKKKEALVSVSQAKHLLSILMGINGRAGTGDRGVDWLAGPALTQPNALHTALTTVYSQHKLPAHSAPADVYIRAPCVY